MCATPIHKYDARVCAFVWYMVQIAPLKRHCCAAINTVNNHHNMRHTCTPSIVRVGGHMRQEDGVCSAR